MKHAAISGGSKSTGYWHEPVKYDIANLKLMAQMDGNNGYSKYSVAGKWNILEEDTWYSGFSINGKQLDNHSKKTNYSIRNLHKIEYEIDQSTELTNYLFPDVKENILFNVLRIKNNRNESINFSTSFGFQLDVDSYHLHKLQNNGKVERSRLENITYPNGLEIKDDDKYNFYALSNYEFNKIDTFYTICKFQSSIELRPGETKDLVFAFSGATNLGYSEIKEYIKNYSSIQSEILEDAKWLASLFDSNDDELNSLYGFSLNASIASYKNLNNKFEGFFAGVNYQSPARTYFRDGFWTVLPILPYKPDWVRTEILTLANGIKDDGSCPSAVIYNEQKDRYEDFWLDHYDSPSFFVMMVYEYLSWTHDESLLYEVVNGKTILAHINDTMNYLIGLLKDNQSLFSKENNCRDWADNVYREGIVLYDSALYSRALFAAESIFIYLQDEKKADYFKNYKVRAIGELENLLIEKNSFNYINSNGFVEDHNTIEMALLVIFNLVNKDLQNSILEDMTLRLESINNTEQTYGDWGVMSVYPFYSNLNHIELKTMSPYRYHNGGDWPYLDGIYAMAKLKNKHKGWKYPLTRWHKYSLEQGWLTPVEYYGPVYGKGSNLQGWSAMPAAAMLMGGLGFYPDLNQDKIHLNIPLWGDSKFTNIHFRGNVYSICIKGNNWEINSQIERDNLPFVTDIIEELVDIRE